MFSPTCGCCKSGVEYIARHVDPHSQMLSGVSPQYLADGVVGMLETDAPGHMPDSVTLAAWIGEYQSARERLRPCA